MRRLFSVAAFLAVMPLLASHLAEALVAESGYRLPRAGGVAVECKHESVTALGVGGSPGGARDEDCAQAGVAKIRDRVG
jgi:uncharacterized protein GlcG (DUF336 family)